MNEQYLAFMVTHGVCVGILVMIGVYLIMSVRSAFQEDVEPNPLVRKAAGWNALLWAVTYAITFLHPLFEDSPYQEVVENLDIMVCMMVVPGVAALLLGLLQMEAAIRRYFWLHLLVPVALIVWYILQPQRWMLYATAAYWGCYAIGVVYWFYRQELKYHRRLMDLYSDMEHHEIRWVYQLVAMFLVYLVLYIVAHLGNGYTMYYISYAYSIGLWAVLTYYVDHHACAVRFWQGAPEAPESEVEPVMEEVSMPQEAAAGSPAETEAVAAERDFSWIGERLLKTCEQEGLYLNHDLSIDVLASHLGTNRTYIGRYLASKGLTYYSYINSLRVAYAKQMMDDNEETSLSTIAFQSGFKSDSTFRRAFSEIEKCTPSEYVKKLKALENPE